jgi:ATP-dependent exoDNAse (exonuclease V) beta subunit
VHATVQSVPFDADSSAIAAYASAQAVAEAVPHLSREVAELTGRALASEAAGRAREGSRWLREVPFALTREQSMLEGFVDLVIQDEHGLEIVDWKTDRIDAANVPDRLREYELQAGLYVLGMQEATGLSVHRVTYVFVSAGVEASPGEPAALAQRAEAEMLGALADRQLRLLDPNGDGGRQAV